MPYKSEYANADPFSRFVVQKHNAQLAIDILHVDVLGIPKTKEHLPIAQNSIMKGKNLISDTFYLTNNPRPLALLNIAASVSLFYHSRIGKFLI